MSIEVSVSGFFEMDFYNPITNELISDKETELSILDNLQQGEYVICMANRTVCDINDLQTPLYTFELVANESCEYEFNEIED